MNSNAKLALLFVWSLFHANVSEIYLNKLSGKKCFSQLYCRRLFTYQWTFVGCGHFNEDQIAERNTHKVGANTAIWLDIHQIGIVIAGLLFLKPEPKTNKLLAS